MPYLIWRYFLACKFWHHKFLGVHNINNIFSDFCKTFVLLEIFFTMGLVDHLCEKWKGQMR